MVRGNPYVGIRKKPARRVPKNAPNVLMPYTFAWTLVASERVADIPLVKKGMVPPIHMVGIPISNAEQIIPWTVIKKGGEKLHEYVNESTAVKIDGKKKHHTPIIPSNTA